MPFSTWLLFCGVALLVTFSPGPGVLLAISNSVAVGARQTAFSSLGNAAGLFIVSAAATAGMGALLALSASAFLAVKLVGALYLVYLGIRQWRSAPLRLDARAASAVQPHTPGRLFLQGLGVAVTNPKAILFFTALFPQFLTPGSSLLLQTVLLTLTFTALALASHAFYVGLFRTLSRFLTEARHLRLFNRISGGLFVLLGLSLLRLRNRAA
ncbi:LysE family translocator [Roseateles saccharophilus]|uniref:Threonine/homoserine/homoserine lactone efflux protein n=1 Tax=Roseateles saccharophilus TaxID=304 RepID=A0A4R3V1R9_ROSSA|nr:LysE family translocator [Roseateles saccharophilus]MDG0831401.1 LysE family translocator [Roseateles saccharophilus]TCU98716.1 threonine/homoserine/homoserine lactone efflux protein [Roseateles saccharophilus]